MFRFIPVLTGLIHLIATTMIAGVNNFVDVFAYNLILVGTAVWLVIRREWILASAISVWTVASIGSALIDLTRILISPTVNGIGFVAIYPLIFFYILRSQQIIKISRTQVLDS